MTWSYRTGPTGNRDSFYAEHTVISFEKTNHTYHGGFSDLWLIATTEQEARLLVLLEANDLVIVLTDDMKVCDPIDDFNFK